MLKLNKNYIFNIILLLVFILIIINIYKSILKKNDLFPYIVSLWILFASYVLRYKFKMKFSSTAGTIFASIINITHIMSYVFPVIFERYSFISTIYIILLSVSLFLIFYGSYIDFKNPPKRDFSQL